METLLDLAQSTKEIVEHIIKQPLWALLTEIVSIFALLAKVVKPLTRLVSWIGKRRAAKIAAALKSKTHVASFTDAEIIEAVQRYIEPNTSNVDPADEDDMRDFAFVRESVFSVIERAMKANEKSHLLVLADSGMGKTTLLLNLFARELKKSEKKRREIALVPLGRADAETQIGNVTNKRDTILLLDAFDEDTIAIEDHKIRLQQLMTLAADFRAVVLTCRTQFFASDSEVPTTTGVARVGPKRAGTWGSYHFQRIYLLPFSQAQVNLYIRRITRWHDFDQRRRARRLVSRIPELTVRPMLLGLLPDLIGREKHFQEIWDLYSFMVESWLKRESNWIEPDELLSASKKIAVDVYLGRQHRRSERLSIQELSTLLEKNSSSIETWKLTGRSLLNRDASGNYKFAHRSIMEFLFILALIEGDDRCSETQWTDMMCGLFLSWGRTQKMTGGDDLLRAQHLLAGDGLSKTGIFPLVEKYEPATRIEASWVRRALGRSAQARARAGIPTMWRQWTSRLLERDGVIRLYEFSEGLVWQCVDMQVCMEPKIYRIQRKEDTYRDADGEKWTRPSLAEFFSLAQTLMAHSKFPLYEQDLYWLLDEDDRNLAMVRLRDKSREAEFASDSREGARLIAENVADVGLNKTLDIYAVPKVTPRTGANRHYPVATAALQVIVWRGNAQARWACDVSNVSNHGSWRLERIN